MHLASPPAPADVPAPPTPALRAPRRTAMTAVTPMLSVVIVNYGGWSETTGLVKRLRSTAAMRSGIAEVVVVDNHSPADPVIGRLRRMPGVSLRRWGRNRGFARAANEGCRLSRGRWLLLLNPDVTPPEDFLDAALQHAERLAADDPRIGIVGFGLRHADGSRQHSCGPFPTLTGTLARLLLPRARRKYHVLPDDVARRVPWVTGCCLLVRADCFRALGGFDEDFFLYYEDVDLCRRARAAGWSVWYDPTLTVTHHHPLHTRAVPPLMRLFTRHALLTYACKHWPGWQLRALAVMVRGVAWLRHRLAKWRGDTATAEAFAALGLVARHLANGQSRAARRQLDRLLRPREATLAT